MTLLLTVFKWGAAFLSHSVGVFSEGIHSLLDLLSALLTFFTVREALKPADSGHPYGHGKLETLSSLVEALLLLLAALWIGAEAVHCIRSPEPVVYSGVAMGVMCFSIGVNFLIYRHNLKVSQKTESQALRVNALHFFSDVVTSVGVLVGLLALQVTGWHWIDPMIAFLIAGYIISISIQEVKKALEELLDTSLPDAEVQQIRRLLESFYPRLLSYDQLKTRKSGPIRHVSFHLGLCGWMAVKESHQLCDEVEGGIQKLFPGSIVTSHVEPCVCKLEPERRNQCDLHPVEASE